MGGLALLFCAGTLAAQTAAGALPATPPTAGLTAPIAATATPADRAGGRPHAPHVSCANGLLTVEAEDSSLNAILRAIAHCTGMRITGGIAEQRVYGNYGPAAPATVLATLIDGTGSNMLLKETAADAPAELILTPRTGGATPPSPPPYGENQEDAEDDDGSQPVSARPPAAPTQVAPTQVAPPQAGTPQAGTPQTPAYGFRRGPRSATGGSSAQGAPNQTPVPQPTTGSVVTSPRSIPQPLNNVNGSPGNVSPTAGSYPTTDSVPLDSVAVPSTTPSTSGIVDAPNPPPAGSDTAAELNGAPKGNPGTTNISPDATSDTSTPGATNTTVPVQGATPASGQPATDLTPEQIFQQLRQRQQQQQQQQQRGNSPQ